MVFSARHPVSATVVLVHADAQRLHPQRGHRAFNVITEAAQGISFECHDRHQTPWPSIVQDTRTWPLSSPASAGSAPATRAGCSSCLKPRTERKLSVDAVIERLRPKLFGVTGINVFLQNPPPIRSAGVSRRASTSSPCRAPTSTTLYSNASQFESRMHTLPLVQDVTTDMQLKNPEVTVEINRDKALALGVTPFQIEDALYYSYGQRQISTIYSVQQPVLGHPGARTPATRTTPPSSPSSTSVRRRESSCPWIPWPGCSRRSARCPSTTGSTPLGHGLFQPQAGGFARRRRDRDHAHEPTSPAGFGQHEFPGVGSGFPVVHERPRLPAPDDDRRHLHDPGHPL